MRIISLRNKWLLDIFDFITFKEEYKKKLMDKLPTEEELNNFAEILQNKFPTNFVYFEKDSSVSNGFEIITQPASIEYLLNIINWKDILKCCQDYEFLGHDAKNAGIHINIDKRFFDTKRTYKLLNIFKIYFIGLL